MQRFIRPGPWFRLGAAVAVLALKPSTNALPRTGLVGHLTGVFVEPGNFVLIPWLFPFLPGNVLPPGAESMQPLAGGGGPARDGPGLAWGLGLQLDI